MHTGATQGSSDSGEHPVGDRSGQQALFTRTQRRFYNVSHGKELDCQDFLCLMCDSQVSPFWFMCSTSKGTGNMAGHRSQMVF